MFIDANEDLNKGQLGKAFRKMKLRDLVEETTKKPGPSTHHRGTRQLDGAFASEDVDCIGARFLPLWTIMGDHRGIVIDIPDQILYGEQLLKVVYPQCRRLQCSKSGVKTYTTKS